MNSPLRPVVFTCLLAALAASPAPAAERMQDDTARVRVLHASPDSPAVDVLVNDALALFTSAQFRDATGYAEVAANVYDVKVVPAGAGPDQAVIEADLNLFYGRDYTVVAVGMLENIAPLVLVDDNRPPAEGRARVRFLHAVPDAPAVDLKVVDGPFLFQDLSFEQVGDYASVPMADYGLELRVAGTDTVALQLDDVLFESGGVYTVVATGRLDDESLGLTIVEDRSEAVTVSPVPELPARPLAGVDLLTLAAGDRR